MVYGFCIFFEYTIYSNKKSPSETDWIFNLFIYNEDYI